MNIGDHIATAKDIITLNGMRFEPVWQDGHIIEIWYEQTQNPCNWDFVKLSTGKVYKRPDVYDTSSPYDWEEVK